jgi:hypothetical protein
MNQDRLEEFSRAYRAGLLEAVAAQKVKYVPGVHYTDETGYPDYSYGSEDVPLVADKMLRAIAEEPMRVNYDSGGFRRAARKLGIKPTRQAILAYLEHEPRLKQTSMGRSR